MRIIIASVKKMVMDTDNSTVDGLAVFLERTDRLPVMNLRWRLTHAIISCKGIQCQCITPGVMESTQLDYLWEHLCILSSFYRLLRLFDGVTHYGLEITGQDADKSSSFFS